MDFEEMARRDRAAQERAAAVQGQAAQAYARLLAIAEDSDAGQAARVARFIAATYNGAAYYFDLFDLRALDVEISDDMLICADALRWGRMDLCKLVPSGEERVRKVIVERGLPKLSR